MIGGQCYELLELLLNDKANIAHTRQRDGSSALHIVVSRGLFDETRLLLRQVSILLFEFESCVCRLMSVII
jgi:ankyrin repeat protein